MNFKLVEVIVPRFQGAPIQENTLREEFEIPFCPLTNHVIRISDCDEDLIVVGCRIVEGESPILKVITKINASLLGKNLGQG